MSYLEWHQMENLDFDLYVLVTKVEIELRSFLLVPLQIAHQCTLEFDFLECTKEPLSSALDMWRIALEVSRVIEVNLMAFYCTRKIYLNFDYLGTLDSNVANTR